MRFIAKELNLSYMNRYRIIIRGHLDTNQIQFFEYMSLKKLSTGESIIFSPEIDNATLSRLLYKIHDCGLELLSVKAFTDD